jgi:predicted RNase H-like HicB family nuclease
MALEKHLYRLLPLGVSMKRRFTVIIEQDEDGYYVGSVPELEGCFTGGRNLDELMKNIKDAIELCLEVKMKGKRKVDDESLKFIGVQQVEV